MKLADLPPDIILKITSFRYDQILEKHEGPWRWSGDFQYGNPEIMLLNGYHVLLPIHQDQHPNITALRIVPSADGKTLTLFLKDTTYVEDSNYDWVDAGRLAICEKVSGASFYIATVYHEWFIVQNDGLP
jgi:hypothetical protein